MKWKLFLKIKMQKSNYLPLFSSPLQADVLQEI